MSAEDGVIDLRDLISELQQRGDDGSDARSTTPNSQFLANLLTGLQRTNRARPAETKAAGAARIRRIAAECGLRVTIVDEHTGVEVPADVPERGDLRQMLAPAAAAPDRGDLRQMLAPAAASRAPETASGRLLGAALNATKPRGGKRAAEGPGATAKKHRPSASKRAR